MVLTDRHHGITHVDMNGKWVGEIIDGDGNTVHTLTSFIAQNKLRLVIQIDVPEGRWSNSPITCVLERPTFPTSGECVTAVRKVGNLLAISKYQISINEDDAVLNGSIYTRKRGRDDEIYTNSDGSNVHQKIKIKRT
jgi:hypothetical protein